MDKAERKHCLQQARDHQRMAVRERELAELARLVGAADQAQRHLLDATLHEKRAEAYAAAAREPDRTPEPVETA